MIVLRHSLARRGQGGGNFKIFESIKDIKMLQVIA